MILESDHDFHLRRARAELDLAYRSECQAAMEAHLRLSSLHMQRLGSADFSARPAGRPSFLPTSAGVFPLRPQLRNVGAREVEAISG